MARLTSEFEVGEEVVYRAPHVRRDEPGEEGHVTSTNERFVFVRFGHHPGGVACDPATLEKVRLP